MSIAAHELDPEPWYRQFWPWFLISIPAITVIGCAVTIYIALSRPHQLVVDDYTKMDAINAHKFAAIAAAQARQLNGELSVDRDTGVLNVSLRERSEPAAGAGLLGLAFAHPAAPASDKTVTLTEIDAGLYRGQYPGNLVGRWHIELKPVEAAPDESWRLSGELPTGVGTAWLAPE